MDRNKHDTSFYSDGNKRVEFCRVCAAEGLDLLQDCVGKFIDKNGIEHSVGVDKAKERD